MVDYINERPPNPTIYDSLKYRYRFDPELKRFSDRYEDLSNEDFNDDEDDDDDCNNDEEAEKNAKELVDEEEKHKTKAEKKKQKKIVQVDPGPEKSKQADNDANENTFKGKKSWSAVISECPHPVESKCSSVDDEDEEDELVELDMNSWFVSNAAAIAKRKMDQKGKAEKKAVQTNSRKQHEPDQKSPVPQDERYYDARRTYDEVLKLDRTCKDAAEEIMRVQLMQLMEMGFTKEQSSNALIIHGTVERALESLSGLSGLASIPLTKEKEFVSVQRHPHPPAAFSQNRSRAVVPSVAPVQHTPELFPIWVGDLVSSLTEAKLYDLFRTVGHVHNVRVLHMRYCAFVNYTSKADCEKAIQKFHNYAIDGTVLVVRYPDRIHTRLGVSRDASTESAPKNT
ncbi:hypothetical protein DNTS_032734 [Danionella cerebrum]|uniref:RRM domain-containing protein n=1 Tax=Danionella cerebrum TaxID=2873325 RepID=A0A553NW08_9TELE|nr:hypothetical protein DNTS_032734 [Danionella translucida]